MKCICIPPLLLLAFTGSYAQADTKFLREFIMPAKLHNGMVTAFNHYPNASVGGIQLVPQHTLVAYKLRGAMVGDVYHPAKNSGKKVCINTTCLQTKELVVFTTNNQPAPSNKYQVRTCINANHFCRAVLASACQGTKWRPWWAQFQPGPNEGYGNARGTVGR